ncbi:hypothetical protein [Streptomyces aidingensis]|uniref:Uncharacterized protein n=1 Tax=Streptomyces aidingensis TaxID=910347 RepID=A0A1I1VBQ2_9ACTN|nr:hypothetical protein [Streptomyces aidingensis]SFD79398.1 hypothetical protein SAMN05421773_13115 [Streptomyces aidingensis]
MPSDELRLKLQEARERKESEALPVRLSGVDCQGYRSAEEIPDWIPDRIRVFEKAGTAADARIAGDTPDEEVDRWIEGFAREHGLGGHVLLKTGMRLFPWMECRLPEEGWAAALRSALGGDLFLVSAGRSVLVVVFEEEHEHLAFAARDTAPDA